MKSLAFERWDRGRLRVNADYAALLRCHGLNTFDAVMHYADTTTAKHAVRQRATCRLELNCGSHPSSAFYLKRHWPPPWREYVKPLLRLTWPILGARMEWEAMIRFHELGIPSMEPVLLGEHRRRSLVMSRAIEDHVKLSDWVTREKPINDATLRYRRDLVHTLADVTRRMHTAGLHHQDYYLGHILLDQRQGPDALRVIDLGRARQTRRLANRWVVKDLAQLNYSAREATGAERVRFLRAYLGRPLHSRDRRLIRRVLRKTDAIARHSRKNRL
jgi:heptose I phosphotransferase